MTKLLLRKSSFHVNNFSYYGALKSTVFLEADGKAYSGKTPAIFCVSDTKKNLEFSFEHNLV